MEVLNSDNTRIKPTSMILTVSELTSSIKFKLENAFPELLVKGEISNFKPTSSGHLYFDLKDQGAKIPAVIFRQHTLGLTRPPKEGDQVIVKGALSVYAPHGRYQLIISELQYQGLGELLLQLEQLKKKLSERGWFDKERKKKLPKFPSRIGVVTSPTGAVIRDIIQILTRRAKGFHLILNPVRVQGTEAAEEIAKAIYQFNLHQMADVLIVGRGGGSLEDLWPFNEEIVAKAIFESQIPIISAVGHETDFTIADFVADIRAPTPSAAAELVLRERSEHIDFMQKTSLSMLRTLNLKIQKEKTHLQRYLKHPLFASSHHLLAPFHQKLDLMERECDQSIHQLLEKRVRVLQNRAKETMSHRPDLKLKVMREKLNTIGFRIEEIMRQKLIRSTEKLTRIQSLLASLNPKKVLKRGYSILFDQKGGSAIVSASLLREKKEIFALLSDGEATLSVISVDKEKS